MAQNLNDRVVLAVLNPAHFISRKLVVVFSQKRNLFALLNKQILCMDDMDADYESIQSSQKKGIFLGIFFLSFTIEIQNFSLSIAEIPPVI